MSTQPSADNIITRHVLWSLGGGLILVPLFDIAAVTAIQMDMLKQLAELYDADYSNSSGKAFVSALAGSTVARLGASMINAVPGIGTAIGGVTMSVMSGASTYAIGQVAVTTSRRRMACRRGTSARPAAHMPRRWTRVSESWPTWRSRPRPRLTPTSHWRSWAN